MMGDFFNRVPCSIMWLAILVLGFACVGLGSAVNSLKDSTHRDDLVLCLTSRANATAVNEAHNSITDLITRTRDNALARVGTSKELPSDKESVRYFNHFLSTIHTITPLNCKALHG